MKDLSTVPLVSVIVPAYNMAAFLWDAVASVRRQTWVRLEIIIVDDGSTDGTGDLAERLRTEDSRVRIVRKANGGLSSARNAGIEALKGPDQEYGGKNPAPHPSLQSTFLPSFP